MKPRDLFQNTAYASSKFSMADLYISEFLDDQFLQQNDGKCTHVMHE